MKLNEGLGVYIWSNDERYIVQIQGAIDSRLVAWLSIRRHGNRKRPGVGGCNLLLCIMAALYALDIIYPEEQTDRKSVV